MPTLPTLAEIEAAAQVVYRAFAPTPQYRWALLQAHLDHVVQVSDDEAAHAMRALYNDTHNVAEGAGAAPSPPRCSSATACAANASA